MRGAAPRAWQIVFAILGLQLFMGDLASCSDPTIQTREACVNNVADGRRVVWENPSTIPGSFDDFGSLMLLLYVMSTADDWDVVMFRTMGPLRPRGPHKSL